MTSTAAVSTLTFALDPALSQALHFARMTGNDEGLLPNQRLMSKETQSLLNAGLATKGYASANPITLTKQALQAQVVDGLLVCESQMSKPAAQVLEALLRFAHTEDAFLGVGTIESREHLNVALKALENGSRYDNAPWGNFSMDLCSAHGLRYAIGHTEGCLRARDWDYGWDDFTETPKMGKYDRERFQRLLVPRKWTVAVIRTGLESEEEIDGEIVAHEVGQVSELGDFDISSYNNYDSRIFVLTYLLHQVLSEEPKLLERLLADLEAIDDYDVKALKQCWLTLVAHVRCGFFQQIFQQLADGFIRSDFR